MAVRSVSALHACLQPTGAGSHGPASAAGAGAEGGGGFRQLSFALGGSRPGRRQRRNVRVEASVRDYVVRVARETRDHKEVELGASPRASLGLYAAAQAWAAIRGRDYVLPDDVKEMAPHVLTHRLMIAPQAQLRGRTPEELVADIVDTVPVPVEA